MTPKKYKKTPREIQIESNEVSPQDKVEFLLSLKAEKDESEFLSRTGKILVGLWEVSKVLFGLSEGKSLVIDRDGSLYTGRINKKKLHELNMKIPGKTPNDFDADGRQEFIRTKSWVNSSGRTFKNAWNSQVLKPPRIVESTTYQLFLLLLELTPEENIRMDTEISDLNAPFLVVDVLKEKVVEVDGEKLKTKTVAMSGYFSQKTGKLLYVVADGEKFYC